VINLGTGSMYWDCEYASIEQCVPYVLSGNRGFCNPNPAYNGRVEVRRKADSRRHHVRHD
jgi:hypothetical protein